MGNSLLAMGIDFLFLNIPAFSHSMQMVDPGDDFEDTVLLMV
jgi:hypothetical protein